MPPGVSAPFELRGPVLDDLDAASLQIAFLFSGAVVTETIFSWPGMGRLFYQSAVKRDYPMLMAILTIAAAAVFIFNLLADIAYGLLDPRVRYD